MHTFQFKRKLEVSIDISVLLVTTVVLITGYLLRLYGINNLAGNNQQETVQCKIKHMVRHQKAVFPMLKFPLGCMMREHPKGIPAGSIPAIPAISAGGAILASGAPHAAVAIVIGVGQVTSLTEKNNQQANRNNP